MAIWPLPSKINNYVALGLCYVIDRPEYAQMCQIVDPYTYLDRYARSQTVLLQNAGNDEFFLCEGLHFNTFRSLVFERLHAYENHNFGHELHT